MQTGLEEFIFMCKYAGPLAYFGEFHVSRVSVDVVIGLSVASITDQLIVPHPKVMLAICPLWKYGDGRPVRERQKQLNHVYCRY